MLGLLSVLGFLPADSSFVPFQSIFSVHLSSEIILTYVNDLYLVKYEGDYSILLWDLLFAFLSSVPTLGLHNLALIWFILKFLIVLLLLLLMIPYILHPPLSPLEHHKNYKFFFLKKTFKVFYLLTYFSFYSLFL